MRVGRPVVGTGRGFPLPHSRPKTSAMRRTKKNRRGGSSANLPGFQSRPLFFAEDLRFILNGLEADVKPLFLLPNLFGLYVFSNRFGKGLRGGWKGLRGAFTPSPVCCRAWVCLLRRQKRHLQNHRRYHRFLQLQLESLELLLKRKG